MHDANFIRGWTRRGGLWPVAGIVASLTLWASSGFAAERLLLPFVTGSAYEQSTGKRVYTEEHRCSDDRLHCSVEYRDTRGELMARKTLDYSASKIAPSLVMIDYRNQQERRLDAFEDKDLVIDAGFDNFVRQRWDALETGNTEIFRFQSATADNTITMRIALDTNTDCIQDELCLQVEVESWLIRAFVDPIELTYARKDRRLLRYSGIGNLQDNSGESMHIDLVYQYHQRDPSYLEGSESRAAGAAHPETR